MKCLERKLLLKSCEGPHSMCYLWIRIPRNILINFLDNHFQKEIVFRISKNNFFSENSFKSDDKDRKIKIWFIECTWILLLLIVVLITLPPSVQNIQKLSCKSIRKAEQEFLLSPILMYREIWDFWRCLTGYLILNEKQYIIHY